jgi:hypothetical protein
LSSEIVIASVAVAGGWLESREDPRREEPDRERLLEDCEFELLLEVGVRARAEDRRFFESGA